MIYCGIDLSTTVAGIALSEDKKIIKAWFVDISKADSYKSKANLIIESLKDSKFDVIQLEESLNMFSFGRTSNNTIMMLAMNKAVIAYILEEHYNIKIKSYNVMTMRKYLFGKARLKGVKPKVYVKNMLEITNPEILSFVKLNKKGNVDKKNEDLYDASVVSLFRC